MVADNPFTCDCCGEYVKSPYTFQHEGVWYSGHKRCMGAPMVRKLAQASASKTLPNIGICGELRSGKDVIAAYLTQKYGYTRFAFGDELKRYANDIFDVAGTEKPRELYQWFGQTMRQRDPDVWVRKCFDAIDWRSTDQASFNRSVLRESNGKFMPLPFRCVISDVRQPNEYARARAEGYVIIRIKAPDGVRIQRAIEASDTFNYGDLVHETESHVSSFEVDYEIENSGSLAELYAKVDAVIAEINEKRATQ